MSTLERHVIKASAGTGKTYTLVQKYKDVLGLGLKEDSLPGAPCSPEEIVAVTFTRKAAAELRERIRKGLFDCDRPDLAEKVGGSFIGTVDGICLRLLQEYALDAGFPPVLRELSEKEREKFFKQACSAVFETREGLAPQYHAFGLYDTVANPEEDIESEPIWQKVLRDLAEMARVHCFGPQEMQKAAEESCREFARCLIPASTPVFSLAGLKTRLSEARLEQCDISKYSLRKGLLTKKTQDHFDLLNRLDAIPLDRMQWKHWFSLIGTAPNPKDKEEGRRFRDELSQLAFEACRSTRFQEDVHKLIHDSFLAASDIVTEFDRLKKEAGVLDFTDMEKLAVQALGDSAVQERLRGRFRVLFVDEYQDTSPLQLRVFQLLGNIIQSGEEPGRVIYVGDDKQSIYSFRGAVPELTRASTPERKDGMPEDAYGWTHSSLPICWRSLPAVTDFVNTFFSGLGDEFHDSFLGTGNTELSVKHYLHEKAGRLSREERETQSAIAATVPTLQLWHLALSDEEKAPKWNLEKRSAAVAMFLERALEDGLPVETKCGQDIVGTRPIKAGDIAVLCRTRRQCRDVAEALGRLGISARLERKGLLEQDEVRLCLLTCRAALNPRDRFALAGLRRLLVDSSDWFDAAASGTLDHPRLAPLHSLHEALVRLTPSEFLNLAIQEMDIFRTVAGWGNVQERFANIEQLCDAVREYEDNARARRQTPSLYGWFDALAEDKPLRAAVGDDAVHIWTCHESKGLQKPVVVLYGLSSAPREPSAWGIRKVCDLENLSGVEDPLELCRFHWLPDILSKTFCTSEAGQPQREASPPPFMDVDHYNGILRKAAQSQHEDDLRLLYVAMTRAQSILAIVTEDGDEIAPGLTRFCAPLRADLINALSEDGEATILDMPCRVRRILPDDTSLPDTEEDEEESEEMLFPAPSLLRPMNIKEETADESEDTTPAVYARWLDFSGADIDNSGISPSAPRDQLGNMLHGWFAVWFGMSREQREAELASGRMQKRLEHFCRLWNDAFSLWPDAAAHLPALSDALEKTVCDWFELRADKRPDDELILRTEWPLEHRLEEGEATLPSFRLDSMRVDFMAEVRHADGTPGPCVIVDHKCGNYDGQVEEELKEHLVRAYGQRQSEYLRALCAMGRSCECWLHLPLEGKMLELRLPEQGE